MRAEVLVDGDLPPEGDHYVPPVGAGIGLVAGTVYACLRRRGIGPVKKASNAVRTVQTPSNSYADYKTGLAQLLDEFRADRSVPLREFKLEKGQEVIGKIKGQVGRYVGDLHKLAVEMGRELEKTTDPQERNHIFLSGIQRRMRILRAFLGDVSTLELLCYDYDMRHQTEVVEVHRAIQDLYYLIEDDKLKAIPPYLWSLINSAVTYVLSPPALKLSSYSLNALQPVFPDYINAFDPASDRMTGEEVVDKFVKFMDFGLYYAFLYSGTEGVKIKNPKYRRALAGLMPIDKLMRRLTPRSRGQAASLEEGLSPPGMFYEEQEAVANLVYVFRRWGVFGVVRYIKDRGYLHPRLGQAGGWLFEVFMGMVGNVCRSIIFKAKGAEAERHWTVQIFEAFTQDLGTIMQTEVLPSLLINAMYAYAATMISNFRRNDYEDITIQRMILGGIIKGPEYNGFQGSSGIKARPDNAGSVDHPETALVLQAFVGLQCLLFGALVTNSRFRDWFSDAVVARMSRGRERKMRALMELARDGR